MAKKLVKYSVVDAFTDSPFKGNPAAVCILEEEKDEQWLQSVATEFNISQTCYLNRMTESESVENPRFRLRWFTPVVEVELCGHATLAAAHTLFTSGLIDSNIIEFSTLSGILSAKKVPDINAREGSKIQNDEQESFFIELNFPTIPITEFNSVDISLISQALGATSVIDIKTTASDDLFVIPSNHIGTLRKVVLPPGKSVVDLQPDFGAIKNCPGRGIIVTGVAPLDSGFDFFSRFFCPKYGVNEDPVCGSAHCALAPYWCKKLGKCDFVAYQASPRGGILDIHVEEQKQRVLLRGKAFTVMEGTLLV